MGLSGLRAGTVSSLVARLLAHRPSYRRNLAYPVIRQTETVQGEGCFASNGAFSCDTGKYTGRSPNDKFIVAREPSRNNIWWGDVNRPCTPAVFNKLRDRVFDHYENVESPFVYDGYCGASVASRKKVRVISEFAWQHHFVTNMFITPDILPSVYEFDPDFTIINACRVTNPDYQEDGLNSEAFVLFDIEEGLGLIGGTWYGGEMKKGMFSMMNYWLPLDGIMPMHCSANVGMEGDTTLFFGLSGTGKTTLSADPNRALIGDDEHGWDDLGIFNFEGGCYAKTIGLSAEDEPEIYKAIRTNALLENVAIDDRSGEPLYDDTSKTENGRVSYPLSHIDNRVRASTGGHPQAIIFLTCDAFGVLPPVARLTTGQAMYQFISGYTAKVAGTERGVTEPTPTFSACFGAAFLPHHPSVYADLLAQKLDKHGSTVYLINTGWTGGAYGTGKRISIADTRACVDAVIAGEVENSVCIAHPVFGFDMPVSLPGVDPRILNPRGAWKSKEAYDKQAALLGAMFIDNYAQFAHSGSTDYSAHGPIVGC